MHALLFAVAAAPLLAADPSLDAKAARVDKQFATFSSPFGVSLDAFIPDVDDRAAVDAFVADDAAVDFFAFTTAQGRPRTPREIVTWFDEHGDMGMFGGAAAAGDAYRYVALRDGGAPAAAVAAARADLLDAIEAFHVVHSITGFPGGFARGVGRVDDVGDVPYEPWPALCEDNWNRGDTWRHAIDPAYADWVWRDNGSKDQLLGATLAMGAFWDAIADDPAIGVAMKERMREDARLLGLALMEEVEVAPGKFVDLVIRDAAGCVTKHHDLNPRELVRGGGQAPLVMDEGSSTQNGFNALAALAIVRTLYHVSGDARIGAFYFDELVDARGYPQLLTIGVGRLKTVLADVCLFGNCFATNFSNVNMLWVAFHQLMRAETDASLRATYRAAMESELWDNERSDCAKNLPQAYFHLVRSGFSTWQLSVAEEARAHLAAWRTPSWDVSLENCDDGEIAAGTCAAIDASTIEIDDGEGLDSVGAVSFAARPPSNFLWRSSPRQINGGGVIERLNPSGDFRLAYWMGRALADDPDANTSPYARAHPDDEPVDGGWVIDPPPGDAGVVDEGAADAGVDGPTPHDAGAPVDTGAPPPPVDAASDDDEDGPHDDDEAAGCGCAAASPADGAALVALLALARRRRRRGRDPQPATRNPQPAAATRQRATARAANAWSTSLST